MNLPIESILSLTLAGLLSASAVLCAQESSAPQGKATPTYPAAPDGAPPVIEIENASAATPAEMKRYEEHLADVDVRFEMVPIPAGTFMMGSPATEAKRDADEGPVHEVRVSAFWMEVHEVSWDEYSVFMSKLDIGRRTKGEVVGTPQDAWADAVSRPTPPYVPMDFSMGVQGFPAICMTQFAAKQYTKWLSMKTGRFYRLPTEAEWEYACRAGTTTAYSWGDEPSEVDEYGWCFDNSNDGYAKIMRKKPNPWGLFDMHGNVAEWTLDALGKKSYAKWATEAAVDPVDWPKNLYPRVVRGGSWDDDVEGLRSAARRGSVQGWKVQDPQLPKSIWYHTDARFVGFRVVRPFAEPSAEDKLKYWEADQPQIREIEARQRSGGR